jgi:hypothetical protein
MGELLISSAVAQDGTLTVYDVTDPSNEPVEIDSFPVEKESEGYSIKLSKAEAEGKVLLLKYVGAAGFRSIITPINLGASNVNMEVMNEENTIISQQIFENVKYNFDSNNFGSADEIREHFKKMKQEQNLENLESDLKEIEIGETEVLKKILLRGDDAAQYINETIAAARVYKLRMKDGEAGAEKSFNQLREKAYYIAREIADKYGYDISYCAKEDLVATDDVLAPAQVEYEKTASKLEYEETYVKAISEEDLTSSFKYRIDDSELSLDQKTSSLTSSSNCEPSWLNEGSDSDLKDGYSSDFFELERLQIFVVDQNLSVRDKYFIFGDIYANVVSEGKFKINDLLNRGGMTTFDALTLIHAGIKGANALYNLYFDQLTQNNYPKERPKIEIELIRNIRCGDFDSFDKFRLALDEQIHETYAAYSKSNEELKIPNDETYYFQIDGLKGSSSNLTSLCEIDFKLRELVSIQPVKEQEQSLKIFEQVSLER